MCHFVSQKLWLLFVSCTCCSYNSMTTWINIDQLLSKFGLSRNDLLENSSKVSLAVDAFSRRLPTYVTIKDVKKRWGKGQVSIVFFVMS